MRRRRANDDLAAWRTTLAAGLVVALVVWGLLEWLRRTVNAVDEAVTAVWMMGKRVAQNTQAGHVLHETKARGSELADELAHHRRPSEGAKR